VLADTAAMLDPVAAELRGRSLSKAVAAADGLARLFRAAGLVDVDERRC
jgi:hypothetical protein